MSLTDSVLVQTFREAMRLWDAQKADGVPFADRVTGLAKSLRQAWPKGRENEWKYLCSKCSDYGLEMQDCPGDATCGRPHAHLPHDFGTPCWCSAGQRFRAQPKPGPDAFTDAGKTPRKSPTFTKFGR